MIATENKRILKENNFLEKVDKVLTGSTKVIVHNAPKSNEAYCTISNKSIWLGENLGMKWGQDNDRQRFSAKKGYNYHEVSHLIHTKVNLKKIHYQQRQAANILEDQRIENFFAEEYPKAKKYFTKTMFDAIDLAMPKNYLLVYGRRFYLPANVVNYLKKRFETKYGRAKRKEAERIIDSYLVEKKVSKLYTLITEFYNLLLKAGIQDATYGKCDLKQVSDASSLSGQKSENSTKRSQQCAEGIKQKMKDEKKGQGKSANSGKKHDKNSENSSMGGGQSDVKDKKNPTINDAKEQMDNVKKEIKELISKETEDDIKRIFSIGASIHQHKIQNTTDYTFHGGEGAMINKLANLLREIRNGLENRYIPRQKSGRFDIRRIIQNQANGICSNKVFKKYKHDKVNKTRMGVAIQIDSSGSIHNSDFNIELQACYVITKALEKLKNYVTVYEFSSQERLLKAFYGKAGDWRRHFYDGTNPKEALKQSYRNLLAIKRKEKLNILINFLITDGQFDAHEGDEYIKKMNAKGIHTVIINVGDYNGWRGDTRHGCEHAIHVDTMEELFPKMKGIIKKLQLKIRRQLMQVGG